MTTDSFRAVVGLARSGFVDPGEAARALWDIEVPPHRFAEVCPWAAEDIDRAIHDGELIVLGPDIVRHHSSRWLITPAARDAITREPELPPGVTPRRPHNPGQVLRLVVDRAALELFRFNARVASGHGAYAACTAVAVMRPIEQSDDVIIMLWPDVREAALRVDAEERGAFEAEAADWLKYVE